MGDLFHQTNAQQTATNQQIGISTRDVGGNVITIGHGAVTGGGSVTVQSLDPKALDVAGVAVQDAIAASVDASHTATEAYQKALEVSSETAAGALQIAQQGSNQGAGVLGTGLNPSQIIWILVAVTGVILVTGYMKRR